MLDTFSDFYFTDEKLQLSQAVSNGTDGRITLRHSNPRLKLLTTEPTFDEMVPYIEEN